MDKGFAQNAEVPKVLERINHQKTISILSEMIKISTENPPGNEESLCFYIDEKCKSLGLETKIVNFQDKRPSLVAEFPQEHRKRLMLWHGHMDTVSIGERVSWSVDPYGSSKKNGKLFGRGTCDMKGGLASMLTALETIINAGSEPTSNWVLTAVADEEDLGRGTMALISSGTLKGASFALFGEPTNLEVVTAHRGSLWLEVGARGMAAHSSMPIIGANSIVAISDFVGQLGKMYSDKKAFNIPQDVSLNVGMISGGTKINVVPDMCTVSLDFRYRSEHDPSLIVSKLEEILRRGEEKNPRVKFTIHELQRRRAVDTRVTHYLVQKCLKIVSGALDREVHPLSMPYTTDASILARYMKIPLVILGPGEPELAHRIDEYVKLTALESATKAYTAIVLCL